MLVIFCCILVMLDFIMLEMERYLATGYAIKGPFLITRYNYGEQKCPAVIAL